MLSRWQEARCSASWWAHSSRRESPSGAASRPTGTSPIPSTAVSSTGQAFRGNDGGVSWLPAPHGGGRVSNPRLPAGTAVRQQHCLPAGGHVGPPLRLVTRASPSRPSRGGGQTRAYRRERLSASNIAYRRADTWVRPYGWSRAHPSPARQWRAGCKPAPTGGNGCPPATLPTGGRTRGSAPTAGHARIPLPPVNGGRVANPRLQAGTVVRQHHRLPAGGHVGPPLRLVTRTSLSRPSREGGFQTRAYRRERLSASTIAYRWADTWVRPYGWSRAHPSPARQGGGFKPAPTGGNGCPPATLPTGGRTRGSAPTAGRARIPLPGG